MARNFEPLVAAAFTGVVDQHSFHVFAVYPWLGLLRAGNEGAPLEILDCCRIRWGRVIEIQGDLVTVISRSLQFGDLRLKVGERHQRSCTVSTTEWASWRT